MDLKIQADLGLAHQYACGLFYLKVFFHCAINRSSSLDIGTGSLSRRILFRHNVDFHETCQTCRVNNIIQICRFLTINIQLCTIKKRDRTSIIKKLNGYQWVKKKCRFGTVFALIRYCSGDLPAYDSFLRRNSNEWLKICKSLCTRDDVFVHGGRSLERSEIVQILH